MALILDNSHKAMDVQSALQVLVLSNNFYIEAGTHKQYLQSGISHHLIWQDLKFWERAIYESI